MSNEGNMQKLEKACFWDDFHGEDNQPCLNREGCKYSSGNSLKEQIYKEGCRYFNSN